MEWANELSGKDSRPTMQSSVCKHTASRVMSCLRSVKNTGALECMANAQLVGLKLRVLFFRRLWIKVGLHLVMSKVSKVVI